MTDIFVPQVQNILKNLRIQCNNVSQFFLCAERYWSVLQSRIRNIRSNLNNDFYLYHLYDGSTFRCSFIKEDADHFFITCPNYANERITLF